mmetsp:Transcript_26129/g.47807  ORF Transcript_26129/g.47807 Transcript_26129/m.47807 type:complete len:120 (-) Transcript_26129:249-608(-)
MEGEEEIDGEEEIEGEEEMEEREGREEEDEGHKEEGEAEKGAEGVYIVADRPEDRFKAAAALMRKRDKADQRRIKDLRKEMRQVARAKRRAMEEEGQGSDGEEGGVVVTLGSASRRRDD